MTGARVRRVIGAVALLVTGCSAGVGSIPGVFTTGDIRIVGLEPDIRECVVHDGMSLAVLGEHFGPAEAWTAGDHRVVFPPNPPGLVSDRVQLVGPALFVEVPAGTGSGTLLIDAGAYGTAEVAITAERGGTAASRRQIPGALCVSNPPPAP